MSAPMIPAEVQALVDRTVLLAALMKAAGAERDTARLAVAAQLPAGSKLTARDPRNGDSLGTVTMSDPEREAVVVDPAKFEAYVHATHGPDEFEDEVSFGDPAQVAAVLAEHAPHLLTVRRVVPDLLREQVLIEAATTSVPGTRVMRAAPTLIVRPNAVAQRVVAEALAGMTDLPALEVGA